NALVLAVTACISVVGAQDAGLVPSWQLQTRQTLESLYPELRDRPVVIDEIAVPGGTQLRATLHDPDSPRSASRTVVLTASFQLDGAHVIQGFRAGGELAQESSNRALARRLRAAPDPDLALAAENLPFGPTARQQLISSLPLNALRRPGATATFVDAT